MSDPSYTDVVRNSAISGGLDRRFLLSPVEAKKREVPCGEGNPRDRETATVIRNRMRLRGQSAAGRG